MKLIPFALILLLTSSTLVFAVRVEQVAPFENLQKSKVALRSAQNDMKNCAGADSPICLAQRRKAKEQAKEVLLDTLEVYHAHLVKLQQSVYDNEKIGDDAKKRIRERLHAAEIRVEDAIDAANALSDQSSRMEFIDIKRLAQKEFRLMKNDVRARVHEYVEQRLEEVTLQRFERVGATFETLIEAGKVSSAVEKDITDYIALVESAKDAAANGEISDALAHLREAATLARTIHTTLKEGR